MDKACIEAVKPIVAMICTSVITSIALLLGINGVALAGGMSVVAALGGYTLKAKTS